MGSLGTNSSVWDARARARPKDPFEMKGRKKSDLVPRPCMGLLRLEARIEKRKSNHENGSGNKCM